MLKATIGVIAKCDLCGAQKEIKVVTYELTNSESLTLEMLAKIIFEEPECQKLHIHRCENDRSKMAHGIMHIAGLKVRRSYKN